MAICCFVGSITEVRIVAGHERLLLVSSQFNETASDEA